jgi:hypothetical protein
MTSARRAPPLEDSLRSLLLATSLGTWLSCGPVAPGSGWNPSPREMAFVDTLEQRTFAFFWERSDPETGLTPDRWPTPSFSSVAAIGFALTAYPIGVERGYVTRAQARDRVLKTLTFLWRAPQGDDQEGTSGYQGFFYHFLDMRSGHRFNTEVELSTIDSALLLGGVLFCQSYFEGPDADETRIRSLADSIYRRVDWRWAEARPPAVSNGWFPSKGFIPYDWTGYDEGMIVYILALGSPTHPVEPSAWDAWLREYKWGSFYGQEHVAFAPLFGHQYSHVWVDFRGIQDRYMRDKGIDYFENSRRATYAQRSYAMDNPMHWTGDGVRAWGLTASDGPGDTVIVVGAKRREFFSYRARGADLDHVVDDGTLVPTAAGGSMPFAPEIALPVLVAMREKEGDALFSRYGFLDAYNLTFPPNVRPREGRVIPGRGWYDVDYLGIDQGPILAMMENWRTGLVWRYMRRNPYIVRGLKRAGFAGGWLDQAPDAK